MHARPPCLLHRIRVFCVVGYNWYTFHSRCYTLPTCLGYPPRPISAYHTYPQQDRTDLYLSNRYAISGHVTRSLRLLACPAAAALRMRRTVGLQPSTTKPVVSPRPADRKRGRGTLGRSIARAASDGVSTSKMERSFSSRSAATCSIERGCGRRGAQDLDAVRDRHALDAARLTLPTLPG